jgi:hypothetical protein
VRKLKVLVGGAESVSAALEKPRLNSLAVKLSWRLLDPMELYRRDLNTVKAFSRL